MSIYSIYFSPTGGTKKVMDILAGEWQDVREIDLTRADMDYSEYHLQKEDVCLIGVPSYGGRVPQVIIERLRKMQNDGAAAVMVVVYGNRAYDDTFLELKHVLRERHFKVKAGIAAVAEHSIMHQYGKGRPDTHDVEELKKFAQDIQSAWENLQEAAVPGNQPYREYNGVPFKPKAGKGCSGCGTCEKLCPVQAIPAENPSEVDEEKCISCMRCISVCPKQVRKINPIMLLAASQKLKKACSGRKKNELFL